jgi:hypothetical protein
MMIIILTQNSFFFIYIYTFLIFAVDKSNNIIHRKETNINFKMTMFCDEEDTNIFQFPNE